MWIKYFFNPSKMIIIILKCLSTETVSLAQTFIERGSPFGKQLYQQTQSIWFKMLLTGTLSLEAHHISLRPSIFAFAWILSLWTKRIFAETLCLEAYNCRDTLPFPLQCLHHKNKVLAQNICLCSTINPNFHDNHVKKKSFLL